MAAHFCYVGIFREVDGESRFGPCLSGCCTQLFFGNITQRGRQNATRIIRCRCDEPKGMEIILSTPRSLPEFQRLFPNEEECSAYLYSVRFPCHISDSRRLHFSFKKCSGSNAARLRLVCCINCVLQWFGQRPQYQGGHGSNVLSGRLRLQIIPNRTQEALETFVLENVRPGTEVRTDGWTGYANLKKIRLQTRTSGRTR
jgi:hypothetical protein